MVDISCPLPHVLLSQLRFKFHGEGSRLSA
jgi:hypothetical protein